MKIRRFMTFAALSGGSKIHQCARWSNLAATCHGSIPAPASAQLTPKDVFAACPFTRTCPLRPLRTSRSTAQMRRFMPFSAVFGRFRPFWGGPARALPMSVRLAPAGRGAAPAAVKWLNGATRRLRGRRVHREVVRMRRGGAPKEVDEAILAILTSRTGRLPTAKTASRC